jgi:uncharacterized membrane protein
MAAKASVTGLYDCGMAHFLSNVVPVWVVTAVGVVVVGLSVDVYQRVASMVAVLAASLVMAFVVQVVAFTKEGLVSRLSLAITGSVLLTAAAAMVFQVLTVVDLGHASRSGNLLPRTPSPGLSCHRMGFVHCPAKPL